MSGFIKRLMQAALLIVPFGSWGFAQVACTTTFAGGNAAANGGTAFTIFPLNTSSGAALADTTTTPRFATLYATDLTNLNSTAASVAFARDPVTNRLYYIENTSSSATARVGYYDFATGTRVEAGTITKTGGDTANFTRFGFNAQGVGYASISGSGSAPVNSVYTVVPNGTGAVTATRIGTITGLPTNTVVSGDFAIDAANRAWLSANGVIYRINLNNLQAVLVFNTGINDATNTINGVAFNPDGSGNLLISSASNLFNIDLGTFTVSAARPMTNQPSTSGDLANCVIPALARNLSVVKTVSPAGPVSPGTALTYTIVVTDTGNAAAINTTFQDSIPANTTYVAGSTTLNGVTVNDVNGAMPFTTATAIKSPGTAFGSGVLGTGAANQATISFRVTVNNPFPSTAPAVSNQGTSEYDSGSSDTRISVSSVPTPGGSGATATTVGNRDFGDAPDAATGTSVGNYQTTGADNGPSHTIISGLRLGSVVADTDDGTLQNATATADNTTGTNDEDGVTSFPTISADAVAVQIITVPVGVTNTTGAAATLTGYLDFNKDGDFLDLSEQSASVSVAANATSATVIFNAPSNLTAGTTYARFRIGSTASEVASSVGAASSGEVEDYLVTIGSPDLTINKSHSGSFVRGSSGLYTLTVNNTGNQPTNRTITVTDTLPAGLSVNGGAAGAVTPGGTNAANWSCTSNAASPQVITCSSSTIIPTSGSSVFTLSVNVSSGAGSSVTNSATVSGGGEATANNGNNSASDPTTTVSPTDLTLAKTHSGSFTVGSTGSYTLTVTNGGEVASSGTITVTDTLPVGLTVNGGGSGAVTSGNAAWTCTSNAVSPQVVTCTSSTAISGEGTSAFTLTVAVGTGTTPGTNSVTNTAAVSGGGDSNTANNGASDPTTILSPDLTVTKVHTPSSFVQGGKGNYRIRIINNTVNSTAPISGTVTVTDTLPSGLSVPAGAVPLTVGGTVWSCSAAGQVITCIRTGTIAIGSNSTFNFDVNVASPAPASVTNQVTVSGGNEASANNGNNSASDPTPIVDAGRLTLTKSVRNVTTNSGFSSAGSGQPGDVLEYCVAYTNPGQSPVTNTVVNDTIPTTTTPLTSVTDYGGQAIRWRTTAPSASSQNLSAPADADAGELGAVLSVRVGPVPAGGAGDVCFQAQIK